MTYSETGNRPDLFSNKRYQFLLQLLPAHLFTFLHGDEPNWYLPFDLIFCPDHYGLRHSRALHQYLFHLAG